MGESKTIPCGSISTADEAISPYCGRHRWYRDTCAAPDNEAEATAWFLGVESGRPKSQIYITMKFKGREGGGGVFVAYCQLADIKLKWLDADTLRISYPKAAKVEEPQTKSIFCGRTVAVSYRRV